MQVRLVIFDFDGTLADSFPWFLSIFDSLAERYHLPRLDAEELERMRHMDIAHIRNRYKISVWKMLMMGRHLKQLMARQIDSIPLVSGMQTVIDHLVEQGVMLAVVSSNARENILRVLGEANAAHFSYFECGVSMSGKKKKFLKVLKQARVEAHQALAIGDEPRDLISARQAHIPFAGVSWGYTSAARLQSLAPDLLFTHPLQILDALRADAG